MQERLRTSKYIKPARETRMFYDAAVFFLFSLFVMPQYFGIPTPLFDFTLLRMALLLVLFMIIYDDERKNAFADLILHSKLTLVLLPYLFVISYTMVLRADINAFLNPVMEFISLYLLIYVIRDHLGIEKTLHCLIGFLYLLTLLGLVEYAMGKTPFAYLETIDGIYTGSFVRSGNYRIMSSCGHSLAYGLVLVVSAPLAALDYRKNEVDLFHRPVLFLLLTMNVFLTGSRSTLGVFIVEVVLIFLFSSRRNKKKCILCLLAVLVALALFLTVGYKTSIAQYILLQIASMIDSVFGTEYSVMFGGDTSALSSSSNYRDQLIYIFTVDWLNPLLGIGRKRSFASKINGSYVQSVDDFYIAEYVRYAYPGLFSYAFFLLYYVVGMLRRIWRSPKAIYKILLICTVCYMINLKWVDSLQTLKYLYVIFALFICQCHEDRKTEDSGTESKYIKSRSDRWR